MTSPLDSQVARRILELWETRRLDTFEIARTVGVHESAVCRLVQASRDVVVDLYRELGGARK